MTTLSKSDFARYHRQIILPQMGTSGQDKLSKAKVFVIGAGGLGSPVLMYLAAAGVGTLGIIDFDKVDLSNLHRQILYNTDDIGNYKMNIVTERLKKLNPEIKIVPYNFRLSKQNILDIIKDYDVIIDGSDNFPTRYLVSDATVILNKPLVFGAVYQFIGQASVFNYKNGPTYRCLFPEQPKTGEIPSCSTGGILGVLPGIIGSIQANEAIKIILDKGETLSGRLFQIDSLEFKIEVIEVFPDENQKKIKTLGEYDDSCEFIINNISPKELMNEIHKDTDLEIYDLRSQEEFDLFNIGGHRVEPDVLQQNIESISKNKKIIIVCEFGEQSLAIVEYLQQVKKFDNVYNLDGGISNWLKSLK